MLAKYLKKLCDVVGKYKSLKSYAEGLRDRFDFYEDRGRKLTKEQCRIKMKKLPFGENQNEKDNQTTLTRRDDMKVNTFFCITDTICIQL